MLLPSTSAKYQQKTLYDDIMSFVSNEYKKGIFIGITKAIEKSEDVKLSDVVSDLCKGNEFCGQALKTTLKTLNAHPWLYYVLFEGYNLYTELEKLYFSDLTMEEFYTQAIKVIIIRASGTVCGLSGYFIGSAIIPVPLLGKLIGTVAGRSLCSGIAQNILS